MKAAIAGFGLMLIIGLTGSTVAEPTDSKSPLWARISARNAAFVPDLTREPQDQDTIFCLDFCLVNDSDEPVHAPIADSKLIVNGKAMENSAFVFGNGPRPRRDWETLRPREVYSFGIYLGRDFQKPGTYRILWKGSGFESPEVSFRVLPPGTYRTAWGGNEPASKLLQKLNEIRLPRLDVSDKTVGELVEFLTAESVRLDPKGEGVKFELRDAKLTGRTKPGKEWNNIPLLNALKRLTELSGLHYDIEADKVVIHE